MSVLIKDMEMPKKCGECAIYVRYRTWNDDPGDEFCGMTKENVSYKTKPDWCPLSEVPERKKGKWIDDAETYYKAVNEKGGGVDGDTPFFCDDIVCSECLAMFSVIDNCTETFNFCPNCGSDMRGNQDERQNHDDV